MAGQGFSWLDAAERGGGQGFVSVRARGRSSSGFAGFMLGSSRFAFRAVPNGVLFVWGIKASGKSRGNRPLLSTLGVVRPANFPVLNPIKKFSVSGTNLHFVRRTDGEDIFFDLLPLIIHYENDQKGDSIFWCRYLVQLCDFGFSHRPSGDHVRLRVFAADAVNRPRRQCHLDGVCGWFSYQHEFGRIVEQYDGGFQFCF
jgi:hypothetical protein